MKFIRIIVIGFLMAGCAIQNPSLVNVVGDWESSGLFYQRIEIDDKGKGYFAIGLDDAIEFCRIDGVEFNKNNFVLNLECEKSEPSVYQAGGYVTPTALVINEYIEDGEVEKLGEPIYFLKETLAESTKRAIKAKIRESQNN